ncbi:uncharacterized protein [Branchiostoma lanceolatum]|uniref:uncharacterized protein n=1 Tax=Branchiostoma lanceolatum TaxID=7740 RepID=UPI00345485E7
MSRHVDFEEKEWVNPMYGGPARPYRMDDEEVERSWSVNSAKRRKQRRQQARRRNISSKSLMFISVILLQIAILACVSLTWQTWCKDQPCQNSGVCVEATDGRYCVCKGGWEGDSCEADVNECKTAECNYLATCQNTAGSYSCQCDQGYEGDGLELCTDIDECEEEDICGPQSLGCINTIGGYNCSCQFGFTSNGTGCVDIDECLTSPCHEFADCINLAGNYTCTCRPGYTGDGLDSCQVLLCENQEDGWFVGSSISDSSWSGLTNDCAQPDNYPFPTSSCGGQQNGGQAVSNVSSHLGYHSWHFKRGYDSPGAGTPYTAPLNATAGRRDGSYQATADSFFASFWFKAANPNGDGSRVAVVAGNPAGSDRASNYLEVYALPEGITVRTAESAPNYTFCAEVRNCGWSSEFHNIVTGLDLQTWHQLEMTLTALPIDYMDMWRYSVDGTYTYSGGAYFQTARYDNGWDYENVNRLKFQPRHTNYDAGFQGFFFDDVHYGVFSSLAPETMVEEYCISFED